MSHDYCLEQLKAHDYYRYLSCLLCPEALRAVLLPVYGFNQEISKIKYVVSEPMVGHIRLQWWREAIEELYAGKTLTHSHEVTRALQGMLAQHPVPKEMFDELINAREADIDFEPPEDMDALKHYAVATSSNLLLLALEAVGVKDDQAREAAHYAGIAYAITGMIRSLRHNAYHRRVMLPLDMLEKQGITADDVAEGRKLDKTRVIIQAMHDKADVHFHHARALMGGIPPAARYILLPVAIVPPFLRRIRACGYDVFHTDLEANQLPMQWALWKARWVGI